MILNTDLKPRILRISGGEINVTPIPLRRDDDLSPWCYTANLTPPIVVDNDDFNDDDDSNPSIPTPTPLLQPGTNFLATQVWPSSRIASKVIEQHMDPSWTICELGCGPGLPSLTAARSGASRVIATDVDPIALELVRAAAIKQGMIESGNIVNDATERFSTRIFDLTSKDNLLPEADLYILSDVFESSAVAEGAAWHVQTVLSKNRSQINNAQGDFTPLEEKEQSTSRVWVFAQSDRAQRDFFLRQMKEWYKNNDNYMLPRHLDWTMDHVPDHNNELWLFDLDETTVEYN
jgi:predicted nicotinamide N-methyase